jgi:hypothetical protein
VEARAQRQESYLDGVLVIDWTAGAATRVTLVHSGFSRVADERDYRSAGVNSRSPDRGSGA